MRSATTVCVCMHVCIFISGCSEHVEKYCRVIHFCSSTVFVIHNTSEFDCFIIF